MTEKTKTFTAITGERGMGMTYLAVGLDIPLGSRDWYKRLNEKLLKDIEDVKANG